MGDDRHGFWRSVPGIVTATAGLITAIGGILAILLQLGVIGGDERPAPPAQLVPDATAGGPGSEVVAVFTKSDGTTIQVRAETVRYCSVVGTSVRLDDTQDVPLEQINSVEVLRSDDKLTPGGTATVAIELVGGERLEGTISSACDFIGFNDIGRVGIYVQDLRRIDFQR